MSSIQYGIGDRLVRVAAVALMILGLLGMVAPILTTGILSVSESFTFPPTAWTLQWYVNFLSRREFIDGLWVSLVLALATVTVSAILGIGISVTLTKHHFRGSAVLNFLILSPITLPRVACGIALFLFFVTINLRGAPVRLFALHLIMTCPYVVTVVTASLQGIDPSLEQAAMNLGASPWETFRRVTLPLIRPGLVAGVIFAFVLSFDEVTASIFLTDARTMTFPVVLFSYMARGSLDPTVAAGASFMLFFVGGIVALLTRYVGLARALGIAPR